MTTFIKNTKQYALAYIERGFSLLPLHTVVERNGTMKCSCRNPQCSAPAKHPAGSLVPHGLKQASSDRVTIKKWFGGLATKNIGITTGIISGIVVLDIDPRHGGNESLSALEEKHGALPLTLRWQTGGGGQHIIFKHPGGNIRNSVGTLGAGIDVRGDGGYIVAPPSRHNSGNYYTLPEGKSLDTPLVLPPAWLLQLMKQGGSAGVKSNKPPIKQVVREQVPQGQRNSTIARVSGHLLAKHVDTRICLDLMLAFNDKYCVPPLDEEEVMRTVASIDHLAFVKLINKK